MSDAPQGPHDALEGGRDAAGYGTPGTGFMRTPADRDEFRSRSRMAALKLSMDEESVGSKSAFARTGVEEHAAQGRSAPSSIAHSAGKLTSILSGRRAGAVSDRQSGVGIEDAKLALALLVAVRADGSLEAMASSDPYVQREEAREIQAEYSKMLPSPKETPGSKKTRDLFLKLIGDMQDKPGPTGALSRLLLHGHVELAAALKVAFVSDEDLTAEANLALGPSRSQIRALVLDLGRVAAAFATAMLTTLPSDSASDLGDGSSRQGEILRPSWILEGVLRALGGSEAYCENLLATARVRIADAHAAGTMGRALQAVTGSLEAVLGDQGQYSGRLDALAQMALDRIQHDGVAAVMVDQEADRLRARGTTSPRSQLEALSKLEKKISDEANRARAHLVAAVAAAGPPSAPSTPIPAPSTPPPPPAACRGRSAKYPKEVEEARTAITTHARAKGICFGTVLRGVCAFDERSGPGTCRYLHPAGDDGLREQVDSEGFWSALGIWRNFRDRGKGASAAAGADI